MKTLPLMLACIFSLGVVTVQAATQQQPAPTKASKEFNVLAIQTDVKKPVTSKTVQTGGSFILVGKASIPPAGTVVECCKDQNGKLHVPLAKFEDLQAYDLSKDGVIEPNEAGYYGLGVARATKTNNVLQVMTLKEAGIKSIILPTASQQIPVVEFTSQGRVPLVIVKTGK